MARTMRIIGVSVCALACVLGPDPASLARADSAASIPPWSTYQQPGTSVVLDSAQRYAGKPTLRIAISADVGPPHSTQRRQSNAVWLLDATPYRAKRVRLQLDDLTTFDRDVATARVIGLGQASAGTAEFLRMKHRLFRDLVERHGVTVLAFDTGVVEAREIDRYVATGRGDPIRALRTLPTWEWQTAEVRDLVKWMRAFNAAPGLHPTLHFAGFDPKLVDRALSNVESFAAKRGAHVQAAVRKQYACMPRSMESWQRLSATWDGNRVAFGASPKCRGSSRRCIRMSTLRTTPMWSNRAFGSGWIRMEMAGEMLPSHRPRILRGLPRRGTPVQRSPFGPTTGQLVPKETPIGPRIGPR